MSKLKADFRQEFVSYAKLYSEHVAHNRNMSGKYWLAELFTIYKKNSIFN